MNLFWEEMEPKNEDTVNSVLQITWVQRNRLNHYLTEKCQFVFGQQTVSLIQQEVPPDELFETPVLPLDKTIRPLTLWRRKNMGKQGETRLFGDFHNVIKLCVCECVCERESLLWVMAISNGGTMAKEAGCRKYCLQGAFNTSEENRISLSLPRSLSLSSRCHIKTSGKHETELLCLFGQEVRNCRDQSSPIIMCLWSANYLWQWQDGFFNTQLHYKDTAKVLPFLCI